MGNKLRVGGIVGAALIVVGVMAPQVHAAPAGPLAGGTDQAQALAIEARIADHIHDGALWEQLYNTPARVAGDIATVVDPDDSALYTGNYLGAESFRYALAKKEIAAGTDVSFWTGQMSDALTRITEMVHQYHVLINISGSWQTKFDLHVNTNESPTDDGFIDFGGGIFEGQPGLLFRACTPVGAPNAWDLGTNSSTRIVHNLQWPPPLYASVHASPGDATRYNCDGATSRDAYAGTTFGLSTALDMVGPDNPGLRTMIANDLITLTNFTFQYAWGTPRPHGRVVIPIVFGGNDLDGFYSPLFDYTPTAQMNLAELARHAAAVLGDPTQELKWNLVWLTELATQLPLLTGSSVQDDLQPHDSYYKFHLDYLTLFNLIRIEPDAITRDQMRLALSAMDATTSKSPNGLYDAFVYALTGSPSRLADAVNDEAGWLAYQARLNTNGHTDNTPNCGNPAIPGRIACVPESQTDVTLTLPGFAPIHTTISGSSPDQLRALNPLPVVDRVGADFIWQKDPTNLKGTEPPTWEPPGDDFLLPYWMIRYYSEVAPPKVDPLPAWLGPVFS